MNYDEIVTPSCFCVLVVILRSSTMTGGSVG